MERLCSKTAIVTGGASGLGRAIAQRLSAEGANVVIADSNDRAGRSTADELGVEFHLHNVTREESWASLWDAVLTEWGHIDVLVNNAGIVGQASRGALDAETLDEWREIFAVNVEGTFLGCRIAMTTMTDRGGSIVNIASIAAESATPYAVAYGASKAAVRHITRSVAFHGAPHKVRCNSVHPGIVRTPLWEQHARATAESRHVSFDQVVSEALSLVPLNGLVSAHEVGSAVAYLASDEAASITGTMLVVDGGSSGCNTF